MRFSHEWLRTYLSALEEPARVGDRLTAAGLPLDGLEPRGDDTIYDLDVFTNRPDCMNHLGVAREYAALAGAVLRPPVPALPAGGRPTSESATVVVEAADLCARYAARAVLGVRVGPSPDWLRRRLESIGQRSINNIVDATNFVLWEQGQPLHSFDLDRLAERRIVVRRARTGEKLRTLDGVERPLTSEMLVIADAARPVAVAGVMGGETSQITGTTRNILLESAWFEPVQVRRTARTLGLRTDASHRFERGADPEGVLAALDRSAQIIAEIAGGTVTTPPLDAHPRPLPPRAVPLRAARARALLGLDLDEESIRRPLERLGFRLVPSGPGAWTVTPPSFRRDIDREVDLIEEIARHRGYDAIPPRLPLLPPAGEGRLPLAVVERTARAAMRAAGLSEAINYAMEDREDCRLATPEIESPVALANPLQANAAFLRTSLLPGLLRNLAHNLNHGLPAVPLFEIGTTFHPGTPLPIETLRLGFVLCGRGLPSHWSFPRRDTDPFDAKGAVELLAGRLGLPTPAFSSDRIPFLEEGEALRISSEGRSLGSVGTIARALLERAGIATPVFGGEIDLGPLVERPAAGRRYSPLPRHPAVRRDLAIVVGPGTPYADIAATVRSSSPLPIAEVQPFDLYRGPGVPEGCSSVAVQIVFQHPDRTLLLQEVQDAVDAVTAALRRDHGVRLRGEEPPS